MKNYSKLPNTGKTSFSLYTWLIFSFLAMQLTDARGTIQSLNPNAERFKRSLPTYCTICSEITTIESGTKKLQEEINEITSSKIYIKPDQTRLSIMEESLRALATSLDNLRKSETYANSKLEEDIKNVNAAIDELKSTELNDGKKRLSDECIADIQAQRFENAYKVLSRMNEKDVNDIVKRMYNNQEDNFDLLLKFVDSAVDVPKNFFVYSAFYSQLQNNNHGNADRLLKLIKSIQNEAMKQLNNYAFVKQADQLITRGKVGLKNTLTEMLKNAMQSNNHGSTDDLLNTMEEQHRELCKEIIFEAVNDVFEKTGGEQLINYVKNYTSNDLVIFGYTAIFNSMGRNNSALLKLAHSLQLLKRTNSYATSSASMKSEYENLVNRIPRSVWDILHSAHVCLKNVHYNEYAYASYEDWDSNNRIVFTWISDTIDNASGELEKFKFVFTRNDDGDFYIKNVKYNEYMIISSNEPFSNRRSANTWKGNGDAPKALWNVIPEGDHFYLKNAADNIYLHADESEKVGKKRYVLAHLAYDRVYDSQWMVTSDC